MDIYYLNSENKKINLSDFPIAIDDITELFGKEWEYDITEQKAQNSSRIGGFYRTSAKKKLKISVYADSAEEYISCMNEFEELTETDILEEKPGKLYCNGYYLECYVVVTEPSDYDEDFYTIDSSVTVMSCFPFWVKEETFVISAQGISTTDNKRYPGRYPCRYANGLKNFYIMNRHFRDANFLLRIYGKALNPQVTIGGYTYLANILIEEGERLEVDSRAGTITKVMMNGERVNAFYSKQKGKSIFKKIKPGRQTITWSGKFDIDIVIYEERSKPKW